MAYGYQYIPREPDGDPDAGLPPDPEPEAVAVIELTARPATWAEWAETWIDSGLPPYLATLDRAGGRLLRL